MTSVSDSGPNISWLDQQLRKERSRVAELQDLVDEQQIVIVDQSQRISALEERLTRLEGQLRRIPEVEKSSQNVRDEVAIMVSDLREELEKRMSAFVRSRQEDREKDLRALNQMEERLEALPELEQVLAVVRAEVQRVNESVMRLNGVSEDVEEHFDLLEETQRRLANDISKNQVASGRNRELIEERLNQYKELSQKLLAVYDRLDKLERGLTELRGMRQELTAQQEELVERQRRNEREQAQKLADWERRVDDYSNQLEGWSDQLRFFSDQHEKNRSVLRDIQTLAHEIGHRQDQLQQLHRVTEEQLRRELREWRSETEQRWAKEIDRREKRRESQLERDRELDERLAALDAAREKTAGSLDLLGKDLESLRGDLSTSLSELWEAQSESWHLLRRAMTEAVDDISAAFSGPGEK